MSSPSRPPSGRHFRSVRLALPVVGAAIAAGACSRSDLAFLFPERRPAAPATDAAPVPVVGRVDADDENVPTIAATPFRLTDQNGAEFDSEALAGKVCLGAIFFANCPGPCFRENQVIAEILREVDHPDFMVVSLTCDPENDTPEILRRYAASFEADPARWKFLTGDLALIKKVGNGTFQLPVELGIHSERGVVFDRQGRLRGGYHLLDADKVRLLVKLIREVLAEPAAEPAPAVSTTPGEPRP